MQGKQYIFAAVFILNTNNRSSYKSSKLYTEAPFKSATTGGVTTGIVARPRAL